MSSNGHRCPDAPSPGGSGMGWWGIGFRRGRCLMSSPPEHPSVGQDGGREGYTCTHMTHVTEECPGDEDMGDLPLRECSRHVG
jgi:hypothetical protein